MNKKSHLIITTQLIRHTALEKHSFWVKLGAIMPDLLFFTYFTGHTFHSTHVWFDKKISRLKRHGKITRCSCFMLGYLLHYLEDYFTYPHSVTYCGSLTEHMRYEQLLEAHIRENLQNLYGKTTDICCLTGQSAITLWQHDYQQEPHTLQTDLQYMMQAGQQLCAQMILLFLRNETQQQPQHLLQPFQRQSCVIASTLHHSESL